MKINNKTLINILRWITFVPLSLIVACLALILVKIIFSVFASVLNIFEFRQDEKIGMYTVHFWGNLAFFLALNYITYVLVPKCKVTTSAILSLAYSVGAILISCWMVFRVPESFMEGIRLIPAPIVATFISIIQFKTNTIFYKFKM